jgi:site-specific DNA-adenine methylase
MNLDLLGKPIFPDIKNIRIPYMGSKNKIAVELLQKMLEIKPNAKYFYDLFGGGGSMSFTALQLGLKVHYNEKQKGMVDLLKYITKPTLAGKYGLFPNDFYNFITREEFFDLINQDTLKSQFAKICYSFGNMQKSYLFGKNIEELKHLGHNIVIFQCKNSLEKFNQITNSNFVLSDAKTWNKRRFDFMSQVKGRLKYKELERLQQLEQLQRLEQLQQLERLQQLPVFTITNLDFRDVKIKTPDNETIIYLDPPYRGTGTYIEKCFFEDVDNYFRNSLYSCFMSEYDAPFKSILEISKRCTFAPTNNSSITKEKLFYNNS